MRLENQNSQNEPGMSSGINEIENRGREGWGVKGTQLQGGRRRTAQAGPGEGPADETQKSKFAKRTWNVRWNQ